MKSGNERLKNRTNEAAIVFTR